MSTLSTLHGKRFRRSVQTKDIAELISLRRTVCDTVEFVVLTLWESMCAVQEFAGQELNRAVVKPEARAILSSFDDFVTHFEIIAGPNS